MFNIFKNNNNNSWENKPFDEESTYEEKRFLIMKKIKPRIKHTRATIERNLSDVKLHSSLDLFLLSYSIGNIPNDGTTNIAGEDVSATPEAVAASKKNYHSLYENIKSEYKIDLIKLAQGQIDAADLSIKDLH